MKPKKRILLVGSNEIELGILRFAIDNRLAFKATCAYSAEEALGLLQPADFDLIVVKAPLEHSIVLLKRAALINPAMSRLYLATGVEDRALHILECDALGAYAISVAELIERMGFLTARKRGPRKEGFRKPPQPEWFRLPAQEQVVA